MLNRVIHPSWESFLTPEVKGILQRCEKALENEKYYPEKKNILRFLETDKDNIKVIIVGMEPYPSSYGKDGVAYPVATGRSFEIANIKDWREKYKQTSMRNILKTVYYNKAGKKPTLEELRTEISDGTFSILQPKDWFDSLEEQGVLFLNATLTVRQGVAGTTFHEELWENFMALLITELEKQSPEWMLWGNVAQTRVGPYVQNAIYSCHPRLDRFVYKNCFGRSRADIDWMGQKGREKD